MSLISVDRDEGHTGYPTLPGRTYVWQVPEIKQFETQKRVFVEMSAN